MKQRSNASHDFLFAKLHGMWARAIRGDALQRLSKSMTVENLQRELSALGFTELHRQSFHLELIERELTILKQISAQLDQNTASFYEAIMARVYYENLKTILIYRFVPEREVEIKSLLVDLPWMPSFPVDELLQAPTLEDFLELLPLTCEQDAEPLARIVNTLAAESDVMAAECAVDQLCHRNLLRKAGSLPWRVRAPMCRLVRQEIDIINLCMLLRNVRTYHLPAERLQELWLHDGQVLSHEQLFLLSQSTSQQQVMSGLPYYFHSLLEPFATADLYLSENILWNDLFQCALNLFRNFDNPSLSVTSYPFLLRSETLNLGRVFEGVHFGIPSRDIRDMMIGA